MSRNLIAIPTYWPPAAAERLKAFADAENMPVSRFVVNRLIKLLSLPLENEDDDEGKDATN